MLQHDVLCGGPGVQRSTFVQGGEPHVLLHGHLGAGGVPALPVGHHEGYGIHAGQCVGVHRSLFAAHRAIAEVPEQTIGQCTGARETHRGVDEHTGLRCDAGHRALTRADDHIGQ